MKLLFDNNLSPTLPRVLADVFPGSSHVYLLNLHTSPDLAVWHYAGDNGFVIVSKDSDFHQLAFLHGPPPKIVWLRTGNCENRLVVDLLRHNLIQLMAFDSDNEAAFLVINLVSSPGSA